MDAPNLPVCPQCMQTDQVQKVTTVFAANTKEWKETYLGTDSWGNSETREETKRAHTVLGLKLKLPDEPAGPTHPGLWYGIGALVAGVLCIFLCSFALVPMGFIAPLLGGSAFLPDIAGVPAWVATLLVIGLPILCFAVVGLGLVYWLGRKIKTRFDGDIKNYNAKKVIHERDELPRWKRAKERWEQLYYCMRDETVFIPAENKAIHVDDMEKYLYDPQFGS